MNSILNKKDIIFLLVFVFLSTVIYGTNYPIVFENKVNQATQIAIGKVMSRHCFWDENKSNIYTANLIEINAYLKKEEKANYVYLITLGGIVEDEAQVVCPSINLSIGNEYLFFLEKSKIRTKHLETNARTKSIPKFNAYAYTQGVLPLVDGKVVNTLNHQKNKINEVLQRVKTLTLQEAKTPLGKLFRPEASSVAQLNSTARNSIVLKNGIGAISTSFYAGTTRTEDELIIEGNGFGSTAGFVQFSNADLGGLGFISSNYETDLIEWTDNKIRVKIPSNASTGMVRVKHSNGAIIGSSAIEIIWAINPVFSTYRGYDSPMRQKVKLLDLNENGGYTLQINSTEGLLADAAALESLERALNTWKCKTGVNFQIDKSGTTAVYGNDGVCVIQYSANLPLGVLGIATSRYKAVGSQSCTAEKTLWYLKEFDLQFRPSTHLTSGTKWNFSTNNTKEGEYDFESIALHELGHAHGLGHLAEREKVMYYASMQGENKRTLDDDEINAGLFKMALSSTENCLSRYVPIETIQETCLAVEQKSTAVHVKLFLEGLYNDQTQLMSTTLNQNNLLPNNQPFNVAPYNYAGPEFVAIFPSNIADWILLQLRNSNNSGQIVRQKAVLLRSDGILIDINGNEVIVFDDLDDGAYYIAAFHRSHLAVMSETPTLSSDTPMLYDFSSLEKGNNVSNTIGQVVMMSSGDFDANGIINNQDFNLWKQNSSAVNIYIAADVDGNGLINNQDFNLWKQNSSKIGTLSSNTN